MYLPTCVKLLTVFALFVCHPFLGIVVVSRGNPICFSYISSIALGITIFDLSIFGLPLKPNNDKKFVSTWSKTSLGTFEESVLQQHSRTASTTSQKLLLKFILVSLKQENLLLISSDILVNSNSCQNRGRSFVI